MVTWEINISNTKVRESKAGGRAGVLKASLRSTSTTSLSQVVLSEQGKRENA